MNNNNLNWMDNRALGAQKKSTAGQEPARSYAPEPAPGPFAGNNRAAAPAPFVQNKAAPDRMPYRESFDTAAAPDTSYIQPEVMDMPFSRQGPPPVMDPYYVAGFLKSLIGKLLLAEFMIGDTLYVDKSGYLREVGVNYFVLEDFISGANVMCDLYSVKFVTFRD